ncbi:MAG: hypothetical protein ACJ735_09345 [Actinomycetes bacterium]
MAAAVAISVVVGGCGRHVDHPTAPELSSYEQAILPTVRDWGSIEIQGMQPAIDDLRSGQGAPAAAIATEATAWQSALRADRVKLNDVKPPSGLHNAATLFDTSIAKYIDAAVLFGRAARTNAGRPALIDAGVNAAKEGDRLYDQASAILQSAHHRLGQSPSPDFPNKPK